MNGRLYDPVIARFFSPDNYIANSSFTQDFNRYTYARGCPLMYTDPEGDFIWLFPSINWSRDGGLSIGLNLVVGIPGVLNVSASVGFSPNNADLYATLGVTAAFNTLYATASINNGFSIGWSVGLSPQMGLPISSNLTTFGVNYNFKNKEFSYNVSALSVSKHGVRFNPSFSAMVLPEEFHNLIKGGGFRSNDRVLKRFVAAGQQQKALEYFGFKGTYAPEHKYFEEIKGAATNPTTGEIFYSETVFTRNYDYLAFVADHEMMHSRRILSRELDRSNYDKEEWIALTYNYRKQWMYPNYDSNPGYKVNLIERINTSGLLGGIYDPSAVHAVTFFRPPWWQFIYQIPRIW